MNESWAPYRESETALRGVEQALAAAPDDVGLWFERARLLDELGRPEAARQAYLEVIGRDAGHERALVRLGALLFAQHYTSAARTVFDRALTANPGNVVALVHRGHLLRLIGDARGASGDYAAAVAIDAGCRDAHQGLAYLYEEVDEALAEHHRHRGFGGLGVVTSRYRGEQAPVRVLQLVSARGGNIPLEDVLDDRVFLVHNLVAEFADEVAVLPAHDVVLNAIGDAERCADALGRAQALLSRLTTPVLNDPARVLRTTRAATPLTLGGLAGVVVPACAAVSRAQLSAGAPPGLSMPFLLRRPGFHTGQHFLRIGNASELRAALDALAGETLYAIEYVDGRSADGRFRKYRVMFIGGTLIPLHLAASSDWKVHYFTADMAGDDALRQEEARFLGDMPAALGPAAMSALEAIAARLGLDYAGVDFTLAADGRVVVFEANATMKIAAPAEGAMWDYRRPRFEQAIGAAQALLRGRAERRD